LRQRGAVDGGERLVAPRRAAVDGAGAELLAGAGLAEDADGDVAFADPLDEREDVAHRGRLADDAVGLDRREALSYTFLLIEDAAKAVVLRADAEERRDGVARLWRPGARFLDEEELPFA